MKHFQFTLAAVLVIGLAMLWQSMEKSEAAPVAIEPQGQLVYRLDNEYQLPLQATHEQILEGFAHHMYQVAGVFRHITTVEKAKANLDVLEVVITRFQAFHQQYPDKLRVDSHPRAAEIMQPARDAMGKAIAAVEAKPELVEIIQPVTNQYAQ